MAVGCVAARLNLLAQAVQPLADLVEPLAQLLHERVAAALLGVELVDDGWDDLQFDLLSELRDQQRQHLALRLG